MSREVHVRFCEGLGVQVPGATHPLFSCQPLAEAVLHAGADFLFACKKDSHKTLYEFLEGAELGRHRVTERKPGGRTLTL